MAAHDLEPTKYCLATGFLDSDHPDVIDFARNAVASTPEDVEKAVALFYAVRDGIRYDPNHIDLRPAAMRASAVACRGSGFCVSKAVLLAAAARVHRIPSRLRFADVRNHLSTGRMRRLMQTDLFVFHGYVELLLEDGWVKATPAFDRELCAYFRVPPLDFDGHHDAMFQQTNDRGKRYMEYVRDRGTYADLPLDEIRAAFEEHYPHIMADGVYDLGAGFGNGTEAGPARDG
jgi:transglutaminase-like putative cysteine protease